MNAAVCRACGGTALTVCGSVDYYTRGGTITTNIARCNDCGTWFRTIDPSHPELITHFDVASYTQEKNEQSLWKSRRGFFQYLYAICEAARPTSGAPSNILDFGCAYGHMLDVFAEHGFVTHGIEIVSDLRDQCRERGHRMYCSIDELPAAQAFNVVALIDSLYCTNDPSEILHKLHSHLTQDGVLLLRIANRAPFLNLFHFLRRPITSSLIGDSKFIFSFRGLERLCARTGYAIEQIILHERGKRTKCGPKALYYLVSPIISRLVRQPITPGIILVCRNMPG